MTNVNSERAVWVEHSSLISCSGLLYLSGIQSIQVMLTCWHVSSWRDVVGTSSVEMLSFPGFCHTEVGVVSPRVKKNSNHELAATPSAMMNTTMKLWKRFVIICHLIITNSNTLKALIWNFSLRRCLQSTVIYIHFIGINETAQNVTPITGLSGFRNRKQIRIIEKANLTAITA